MKNYPPIVDPLVLNFISCSELPLYLINNSLGFRAQGHSYMDTPYTDEAAERWTDTPRYAMLAAEHQAKEKAKAESAAAAKASITEVPRTNQSCEAPLIKPQGEPVISEVRPTEPTAREKFIQPESEQIPAETNRLTENSSVFIGSENARKHRGIDRMACAREEAHRIAAAHPWL